MNIEHFIPVAFFGAIGFLYWRIRRARKKAMASSRAEAVRRALDASKARALHSDTSFIPGVQELGMSPYPNENDPLSTVAHFNPKFPGLNWHPAAMSSPFNDDSL